MRRLLPLLVLLLLVAPPAPSDGQTLGRTLHRGQIYLGTAPGFALGGHAIPRALYMDALQAGYVFPNGIDLSYALTGMNWFPDVGDYSITMNRFAVGWRPFLSDPLPMIQPYVLLGAGFGGEG